MSSCPLGQPIKKLSFVPFYLRYVLAEYKHYYVDTEGDFKKYLGEMRGKTRNTLRRKVKKFSKAQSSPVVFRQYATPEELDEFFALAWQVSRKTYQERMMNMGLPRDSAFVARQKELAAQKGVIGFLLFFDEKPVAYVYGPLINGYSFLYDYVGFDPEFQSLSPGTVLQYYIIEALFANPQARYYDLCVGEGEHKRLFATGHVRCADVLYVRKDLPHAALIWAHLAWFEASRFAVFVLDKLQVKDKIKKTLRRMA
ncbi:MAG: GNAT family N-acetyltransferase [Desulfarculaceae bacterium]|nr:GNAT family N-acetyltransferase [Desulfarculaceae bacterium]MCF8074005.1 GNAT family N-acetyltransferase [Desulfarculaceae bacterium]MCF8102691.1 GNAT family N-acetyltransferase [Desulfarculaceae bacterium]MCF8116068.1 GNAT family N-acetyltransferase [Desulfarculaceae bacterium]